MPKTKIIIYQESDATVPLLDWLDKQSQKVRDKCMAKIERLAQFGFDLRRPDCDILRDGIYELRIRHGNVNHRILYAFSGKNIVLLSHGCTKEKEVPQKEIDRALNNLKNYRNNCQAHTYREEL